MNERWRVHQGDCRLLVPFLGPESIDSCVTDPPYDLTSIVKRFAKTSLDDDNNTSKRGRDRSDGLARLSRGFMGQTWDGQGVAFDPKTWSVVYDVLKPGAHLVAFGGTRTYHRMVCAIEDAGFEIRDQLAWVYGSGFPKSHDVAKGIDKHGGANIGWFGPWLRAERERRGIKQKDLAHHFPSASGGLTGCVANWELGFNLPTPEQFNTLCKVLSLPFDEIAAAEREVLGRHRGDMGGLGGQRLGAGGGEITAAASAAAREWQGWGTALKPAWEPIVLARKPLVSTVAGNVLQHGTGALNIDGCRVETNESTIREITTSHGLMHGGRPRTIPTIGGSETGRWPANIIHDGSDEVLAGFPDSKGQQGDVRGTEQSHTGDENTNCYGEYGRVPFGKRSDSGSAARFFYCAKASKADRGGDNIHPTVKPTDLMRWLCRLVTPPGGVILDPFTGSGSTGKAAMLEGFRFEGFELTPDYIPIARARIAAAIK